MIKQVKKRLRVMFLRWALDFIEDPETKKKLSRFLKDNIKKIEE
tara:strand:+ start:2542 stop:2673 length:132 start_codon:yes stop_codon:yes gene_type:complete